MSTIALTISILFTAHSAKSDVDLYIDPTIQQTEVWCWSAVAEMALTHYGYDTINPGGNFQCGIVAMLGGVCNVNCFSCRTGIGSTRNLAEILKRYEHISRRLGANGDPIDPRLRGTLSERSIKRQIDEGNPIIAGISPSGLGRYLPPTFGEHVALIVGYEDGDGEFRVLVNDPFPYGLVGFDPYVRAGGNLVITGQYSISLKAFTQYLGYKDSIVLN